jgi:gamma-glutamyltranspeptidase/glutathione hydrolase
VPGCVDGWFELHARYGRLPMAEVLAPAIAAARDGVPVPQVIAGGWASGARVFREKPGFAEVFLPGGRAPTEGEVFANPALARTLEMIAAAAMRSTAVRSLSAVNSEPSRRLLQR